MTKTRIGFIGAGGIAGRHLGNLLDFADVQVVALADIDEGRAREQAARAGAAVYTDYRRMVEEEALDALYICLPPFAHGGPEEEAVGRGLPFFVEKPLSVDGETAERIGRGVEEKNLVTAVGYHWRYLDTTEQAQRLLAERPARLALGYWLDSTPPPAWWRRDDQSGGQMVEQTTHIFDLARVLVGEPASVYAAGGRMERDGYADLDIFDVTSATVTFASGAVGTFASTCILNWPHRIGLHTFSEGMAIELTEWELMVDVGRGRPIEKPSVEPFIREDRDFIDAIQGKPNRIRAPYAEALKTHRLTVAAARSAREGRPVRLESEVARV